MLFYKTVSTQLLELLKGIQQLSVFKDLRLVGGTSLALQIGHRKSVDIDLFGSVTNDDYEIIDALSSLGKVITINKSKNIQIYTVNNIKVDIVNYRYKWIEKATCKDKLNLAGIRDIAAMKLNAVSGRGTKKDFIDVYFMLQYYSLSELMQFYQDKYHDGSIFLVFKSLTYFEDAEKNEMPVMLKDVEWETVKKAIKKAVYNYSISD